MTKNIIEKSNSKNENKNRSFNNAFKQYLRVNQSNYINTNVTD